MGKRRLIAGTINRYPAEEGWTNFHLDASNRGLHPDGGPPEIVAELGKPLPMPSELYDEVRCWQTLEHLRRDAAIVALSEFFRVLKHEGAVDISVPDLDWLAKHFAAGKITFEEFATEVYGDQTDFPDADRMTHRWGWNGATLSLAMARAGFCTIRRVNDGLRFRGVKP